MPISLILASASPRRREILTMAGVEQLTIIPAMGAEDAEPGLPPDEVVRRLALAKAREVAQSHGTDVPVIAADTIVWLDGEIYGKPRDEAHAIDMLGKLSGRTHSVFTGVAVLKDGAELVESEKTQVTFRELTPEEIRAYVATGEPMDKAGAYGAQGVAALFVERLDGDFFNVMGLPLCRLGIILKKIGVELI